ncbi:MAG TPA: hypothetical protein VGO56_13750 [Pyrinomonadaceae bacterium]|jgi:hypothetical protein|nr:hypothetical protein [Pyrinomonadaceae bacterium]
MAIEKNIIKVARRFRFVAILSALLLSACAALQPPSATGPRGSESNYPVLLIEDTQRKEATLAALNRLGQSTQSSGSEPQLQQVTGTILSLPANASGALYLPKLGAAATMTEEETRESLRRFIRVWQELIGSDPAKLSLIERTDQPDGSKLAAYEQRPFRYPIRGNYGKLQIVFTNDRRVVNLSSTCIPDADRIQSSLSALNTRPKAEDAIQQLRTKGLVYLDANGNEQTFTIGTSTNISARQMTIYVLPAKNRPEALEFHLAWEIELTNAPVKLAYVDALTGETVATEIA